jgi:hypothetical protein
LLWETQVCPEEFGIKLNQQFVFVFDEAVWKAFAAFHEYNGCGIFTYKTLNYNEKTYSSMMRASKGETDIGSCASGCAKRKGRSLFPQFISTVARPA